MYRSLVPPLGSADAIPTLPAIAAPSALCRRLGTPTWFATEGRGVRGGKRPAATALPVSHRPLPAPQASGPRVTRQRVVKPHPPMGQWAGRHACFVATDKESSDHDLGAASQTG